MNNLTDLEIHKKITLIELNKAYPKAKNIEWDNSQSCFWVEGVGFSSHPLLKPLTDDALCFKLMVKYDCDLISPYRPNNDTHWECQIFTEDCADAVSVYDDSPNKAICLAIIEAHKDQS